MLKRLTEAGSETTDAQRTPQRKYHIRRWKIDGTGCSEPTGTARLDARSRGIHHRWNDRRDDNRVAGSSETFMGSVVSYSNDMKIRLLGFLNGLSRKEVRFRTNARERWLWVPEKPGTRTWAFRHGNSRTRWWLSGKTTWDLLLGLATPCYPNQGVSPARNRE